jgi:polyisoprenyl-phosphate glycosyltransferase
VTAADSAIVITMPVFEDWAAARELCSGLDAALASAPDRLRFDVVLIDDGSLSSAGEFFEGIRCARIGSIRVLTLARNIGHQRAIAIGLTWIQQHTDSIAVLLMDADGEDRPQDACRLLAAFVENGGDAVVFAERGKRLESASFRFLYSVYRGLHRILTGTSIRVGNFSVIPRTLLDRLVTVPELWNHYAASVFASRLPRVFVRADRGPRLRGYSHMNFVAFVIHGLSAIATYREIVGTRILVATGVSVALLTALLAIVVGIRLGTGLAIPGWATVAAGLIVILLVQSIGLAFLLTFAVLAARSSLGFLPVRDYAFFVRGTTEIYAA